MGGGSGGDRGVPGWWCGHGRARDDRLTRGPATASI
jgi:hypothetical protein